MATRRSAIALMLFLSGGTIWPQTGSNDGTVSTAKLTNVLYCLQSEAPDFGSPVPRFEARSFRIRYYYGKLDSSDQSDQLDIVVYGPREKSATLFEVYLETKSGKQQVFFGTLTTFKTEKRHLVTDEIPGGLATLRRIEKLFSVISRRNAITIKDTDLKPSPAACVYER